MSQRTFVKMARKSKPRLSRQAAMARMGQLRGDIRVHNVRVASAGELKNIDVTSVALLTAAQTTGTLLLLNGVTQGTSATTRLGRRTTMKSIYIRINVALAATTAGASPLRYMVVYDKQTNATAPAATDILVADAIVNPNNLSNSRRFVTLMDWVTPDGIGVGGPVSANHTFYKKLNLPVEYNVGVAGNQADIQTGSVYVLVYQNGGLITAAPTQAFFSRIRFSDN